MAKILLIETSTALCSVALEIDGEIKACRRSDENRAHASLTAVFCDETLKECGLKVGELDAVCISEGPGSYTGLRVGLSTAKGLCFGAGVKLLSVCSLDILAMQGFDALQNLGDRKRYVIPMIDARRMEVYTAIYEATVSGIQGPVSIPRRTTPVAAKIITDEELAADPLIKDIARDSVFIGDGASKCKDVLKYGIYMDAFPEATAMAVLAEREFSEGNWRNIAYFEPFYLKEFVATTSKKKLF